MSVMLLTLKSAKAQVASKGVRHAARALPHKLVWYFVQLNELLILRFRAAVCSVQWRNPVTVKIRSLVTLCLS